MKKKVAFLDVVHPVLENGLQKMGIETVHFLEETPDALKELITDVNGIVIRSRIPMNEELLKHAPYLEFIGRSGAGMENIDIEWCEKNNIQLFNAPEGNRNAVGEHALGMLLSLFNHLHTGDQEVRKGLWDREGNRGIELDGKTVGIIGYGNNGSAFAKKLLGFDVDILAYDKYKKDYAPSYVEETTLDELFDRADVLSFHIPQNDETLFMADGEFFRKFRKNIYVINLARGKIIVTRDLVQHLKEGKISGACLDVLEYEKNSFENLHHNELPKDFKYLLEQDNVILSPHVGGWTVESYEKLSQVLLDKITHHLNEK